MWSIEILPHFPYQLSFNLDERGFDLNISKEKGILDKRQGSSLLVLHFLNLWDVHVNILFVMYWVKHC